MRMLIRRSICLLRLSVRYVQPNQVEDEPENVDPWPEAQEYEEGCMWKEVHEEEYKLVMSGGRVPPAEVDRG